MIRPTRRNTSASSKACARRAFQRARRKRTDRAARAAGTSNQRLSWAAEVSAEAFSRDLMDARQAYGRVLRSFRQRRSAVRDLLAPVFRRRCFTAELGYCGTQNFDYGVEANRVGDRTTAFSRTSVLLKATP